MYQVFCIWQVNVFFILDREVFGILNWEFIWQVFARICHFGLGGIWQVFACIWYFGLGGVLFRRILSSEGKSSSDGGKSETCSHNATISAFFCRTSFGLDSRQEFQITQQYHSSKEFPACSNYAGSQSVRPMQAMLTQF